MVKYLPVGEEQWKVAQVMSKAGKNKGKFHDVMQKPEEKFVVI